MLLQRSSKDHFRLIHVITLLIICINVVFCLTFSKKHEKFRLHRHGPLRLNRVYFHEEECQLSVNDEQNIIITLSKDDYRAKHIQEILKAEAGDRLKVGLIDVGRTDDGILEETDHKVGVRINLGERSALVGNAQPLLDLMLAVPRPLRLERLLPVVAMLGVGRLILIDAQKVEKAYFGSHLFRGPEALRAGLVEGLEISDVDCRLPEVLVRRRLGKFLATELDELYPPGSCTRLLAHPTKTSGPLVYDRLRGATSDMPNCPDRRIVLAVGPEGGWTDEEVALLSEKHLFTPFSAGERIMRTDVAVPVLLGLVRDLMQEP